MCGVRKWLVSLVVVFAAAGFAWNLPLVVSRVAYAVESAKADVAIQRLKPTDKFSAPFEEVAEVIKPSLVSISSTKRIMAPSESTPQVPEQFRHFFGNDFFERFFGHRMPEQGYVQEGLGSGVIVSDDGYILTNAHVVDNADKVTVKLSDDREYQAKVIGTDTRTDLAVVKIHADGLYPAKLGNSDSLRVGEWVVAAGIPFGLSHTITAGIISAKGRTHVGIADYEDFIQTDAAINPGNSGGPLVDLEGKVIGINTAIFTRSGGYMGIGFAIPINMAKSVMESLIKTGHVVRGYLGVSIQNLTPGLAKSFDYEGSKGALVGDVSPDSPAAKAGIKQGDIITSYAGKKVKSVDELRSAVAETKPGTEAEVDVFRNGKEKSLKVKVGELEARTASAHGTQTEAPDLGMTVKTLTPELAQGLGLKEQQHGVVVTEVEPGGLAATAGIRPNDLIVSVQGKAVENAAQFREETSKYDLKKGIRLVVQSGGTERFVFLRATE
jgi:serine protease Do